MLQARVRILLPAWRARKQLGLSVDDQRRIRSLVYLEPLNARLCYPTISVRNRFRRAGVYERIDEFRDWYGMPLLVRTRYLYVAHDMPVFLYELCALWPCANCSELSLSDMGIAETVAGAMVTTFGDPV